MQANLFIELFGGFETQISTLKALSVSHIIFSYKILNFSKAQVDPLYKNMLFYFCTVINGQVVHGTSWHYTPTDRILVRWAEEDGGSRGC